MPFHATCCGKKSANWCTSVRRLTIRHCTFLPLRKFSLWKNPTSHEFTLRQFWTSSVELVLWQFWCPEENLGTKWQKSQSTWEAKFNTRELSVGDLSYSRFLAVAIQMENCIPTVKLSLNCCRWINIFQLDIAVHPFSLPMRNTTINQFDKESCLFFGGRVLNTKIITYLWKAANNVFGQRHKKSSASKFYAWFPKYANSNSPRTRVKLKKIAKSANWKVISNK